MVDYVLEGPKWGTAGLGSAGGVVTWAIDSTVPAAFVATITAAFADWASYANITFQEVSSTATAQIDFMMSAIDGVDNILGQTNYSYSGSRFTSADVDFDSSEGWHVSGNSIVSTDGVNFFPVALHEIGHALGLDHYNAAPAIMNGFLNPSVTNLAQSDIDGIEAIYGHAVTPVATTPPVSSSVLQANWTGASDLGVHPGVGWQVGGFGDFNADHNNDVLWFNQATGETDTWLLNNGHWTASASLGTHPGTSTIAGVGDFNGDGTSDVLWYDPSSGHVDEWKVSNDHWAGSVDLGMHPGTGWTISGTGDFNADHTSDILWSNAATGQTDIWELRNGRWSASVNPGTHATSSTVAGVGDFTGDGSSDILWFNATTGDVDLWKISNGKWAGSIDLGPHPGTGWVVTGTGDYNADGTSDILWSNATSGATDVWLMSNGHWSASVSAGTHAASDWLIPHQA